MNLERAARSNKRSGLEGQRARIPLAAADGGNDAAIARTVGVCVNTVTEVRRRFCQGARTKIVRRSEQTRRKAHLLDGQAEAYLVALVCAGPPEGRKTWTMHLLAVHVPWQRPRRAIGSEPQMYLEYTLTRFVVDFGMRLQLKVHGPHRLSAGAPVQKDGGFFVPLIPPFRYAVFPQNSMQTSPLLAIARNPWKIARLAGAAFTIAAAIAVPQRADAAFGVTSSGGILTVDTGGGLVYKVNGSGDVPSIKLNGTELNLTTQSSCVNAGFGATSVVASGVINGNLIRITCTNGDSIHYYLVKSGDNIIYMATYAGHDQEWRFIPRLNNALFKTVPYCSDYSPGGTDIESADCIELANGDTVSKYFGNAQAKDDIKHSVSGTGGTATMWMGNRETTDGGPFMRDIQTSAGSTGSNPYNYMHSGHALTGPGWRAGLHGIYALAFNNVTPDLGTTWDAVGLYGYRKSVDRGRVIGNGIIGLNGNYTYTVGFESGAAQYWSSGIAGNGNGAFSCYNMKPGIYDMTIYRGELAVQVDSVTVSAGSATTVHPTITNDPDPIPMIWRFGKWDGKPSEFLNAAPVLTMHPSDHRLASWGPVTVPVTANPNTFPCYHWRDINNNCALTFNLTSSQVAAHTVRIGITAAISGGRPQIKVNSWLSPGPGSSTQPDSRVLTIGTYRGNNVTYTYNVPASAFVAGTNTLTLFVISGTGTTGWTGPGISLDCIQLDN